MKRPVALSWIRLGECLFACGVLSMCPLPAAADLFGVEYKWSSADDAHDWYDRRYWYSGVDFFFKFADSPPPNDGVVQVTISAFPDSLLSSGRFYPKIGSDANVPAPNINLGSLKLVGTPDSPLYLLAGSLSTDELLIGADRLDSPEAVKLPTFRQVSGTTNTVRSSLQIGLFDDLFIDNPFPRADQNLYGNRGAYIMTGGTLTAPEEIVGDLGIGSFSQSGGFNAVAGILWLGKSANGANHGVGSYALGLSGELTAAKVYVGAAGEGTFEQSGGMSTISDTLALGVSASGMGTYTLSDIGVLSSNTQIAGYDGQGTFVQSGGSNTTHDTLWLGANGGSVGTYRQNDGINWARKLTLAQNAGSKGVYVLSGGEFSVGDVSSGAGDSFLDIDGGTFSLFGTRLAVNTLTIGAAKGSDGSFALASGQEASTGATRVGFSGTGRFTLNGGTHAVSANLAVGENAGSVGTYTLNSGSLTARREDVGFDGTGTFIQNGGTNTVTDTLAIGAGFSGKGLYELNGGAVSATDIVIGYNGSGLMRQGAGTTATTGTLWLGINPATRGEYVQSGGTHTIDVLKMGMSNPSPDGGSVGVYSLRGGTLNLGSIVAGPGGRRDLGQGSLILDGGTFNLANDASLRLARFILGERAEGDFSYALTGQRTLTVYEETIGLAGRGTFDQRGGQHIVSRLALGELSGGSGRFSLQGGELSADNLIVGGEGAATFVQTGGTNTVSFLIVGQRGNLTHSGGSLIVPGQLRNAGAISFIGGIRTIVDGTVNEGSIRVEHGAVDFGGTYTEKGVLTTDPSVLLFNDVTIEEGGYWVASAGDAFRVRGQFVNRSRQSTLWNTDAAVLVLAGDSLHVMEIAGADRGSERSAYAHNFAWHVLALTSGGSLSLLDGNDDPGGAFYVDVLALADGLDQIGRIHSPFNIYYDPSRAENAYLNAKSYALDGGGQLIAAQPVPEPGKVGMMIVGLALMVSAGRWRRARSGRHSGDQAPRVH